MGFELPNGKTARNLQDQVKFLTEKIKELIARVNELELHIEIVDELPETGSSDVIYFVPVEDPEEGNYYNEYMWIDDTWELIGTTQIDLSGYVDLASAQTITGTKRFTEQINFGTAEAPYQFNFKFLPEYGRLRLNSILNSSNVETELFEAQGVTNFILNAHFFPRATSWDIGRDFQRWRSLYLNNKIDFGTRISGRTTTSYIDLDPYDGVRIYSNNVKAATFYDSGVYIDTKLLPNSGNVDIGDGGHKIRNIYISGNLSNGTNTVTIATISKTRLYLHRFQFTYTGGGGYLNVITNSATAISDTESDFQTAINSAVSVYVNQSDGSRALFLSASLSQNDCRWFTSSGTASGGSVSFGLESIAEIQ